MRWAWFQARRSSMIFAFVCAVERGQRFVEKQHLGIGHERSRQSHALALSARNVAGIAPRGVSNAKCLENRCRARFALGPRPMCQPVLHILFHGQVRKQRQILKYVSHATLFDGKIRVLRGIEQDAIANRNPS